MSSMPNSNPNPWGNQFTGNWGDFGQDVFGGGANSPWDAGQYSPWGQQGGGNFYGNTGNTGQTGPWGGGNTGATQNPFSDYQEFFKSQLQSPEEMARSQGYIPDVRNPGSFVKKNTHWGDEYKDVGDFQDSTSAADWAQAFLERDVTAGMGANQADFQRKGDASEAFRKSVEQQAANVRTATGEASAAITGAADEVTELSEEQKYEQYARADALDEKFVGQATAKTAAMVSAMKARGRNTSNHLAAEDKAGNPQAKQMRADAIAQHDIDAYNIYLQNADSDRQNEFQLNMATEGLRGRADESRLSSQALASNLTTTAANISLHGETKASELELMGMGQWVNQQMGLTFSPYNWFDSLVALNRFVTTEGSENFVGFDA